MVLKRDLAFTNLIIIRRRRINIYIALLFEETQSLECFKCTNI